MSYVHGKTNTYTKYGCRCVKCTTAIRKYHQEYRKKNKDSLPADDPRHGRLSTYTGYGCRCEKCKAAAAEYQRERKARIKTNLDAQSQVSK